MAERQTTAALDKSHDLPSLLERLGQDVIRLLDQKLALLKIEVKEDIDAYVRGSIAIVAGAVIAAVGFALVSVALAFAISTFFANLNLSQPAKYALSFVITGALYLTVGAAVIVFTKNRLARVGLVPQKR